MALSNLQAEAWITALQQRLSEVYAHPDPRQFLTEQYFLLFLLNRALDGEVTFTGAPVIREQHE